MLLSMISLNKQSWRCLGLKSLYYLKDNSQLLQLLEKTYVHPMQAVPS